MPAKKGFTLIELLVVIAIISVMMSAVIVSVNPSKRIAEAKDSNRLNHMNQIVSALEAYRLRNGQYPAISADACCDGWDQGPCNGSGTFIDLLRTTGFLKIVPVDPTTTTGTGCYGYGYYRYPAGSSGCSTARGAFYVLGVRNMESVTGAHPSSPGWSCPSRNWQGEYEWVTGSFEN